MTIILIALGAAVGAPLRYAVDRLLARHGGTLPWGTLAVNVVGSFVLGFIASAAEDGRVDADVLAVGGVGFCGALTTYSTFGYETWRLFEDGARWYAVGNVVGSVTAGVAAAALGWALA